MSRRVLIYFALFFTGFFQFIGTGEFQLITDKPQLWILITAMAVNGGMLACLFATVFPELAEAAENELDGQNYDSEEMNAMLSSSFVFVCQLAMGFAPMLSSSFYNLSKSYTTAYRISGATVMIFSVFYLVLVGTKPYNISLKREKEDEEAEKL